MTGNQNSDEISHILFDESPISLWHEDFSEVKKFIDQLKASGVNDLRVYCESHPEAVYECAKKAKVINVNKATLNLYKARNKKDLLTRIDKTFTDESFEVFRKELLALAKGKTSISMEAVTKTLTGERVDIIIQIALVAGYEDTWAHVLVSMTDISARKQAEKTAFSLNKVLEESLNEIYIFDAETLKFIQANYGARLNLGYEMSELRNLTPLEIKPEFTKTSFEKLIEPLRSGIEDKIKFTTTHLRKDRSLYPVEVHLQLSMLESRKIFVAIILDITKRKKDEEALNFHQAQLKALMKASLLINTSLDQATIRKILVSTATDLLHTRFGTSGIVKNGHMVFSEYLREGQWSPIDYTFKPGYGVPGHVMQTGKPYITNDAEHDTHVIPDIRQALDFHQLIDVPILNRSGKVLGCFEIHDPIDEKPFDDTDIELLEGLAASAAIALENANLFSERDQIRKALEESSGQLKTSLISTVVAISRAVGARDPYTAGHQQRVSQLSRTIAQEMGLDSEQIEGLRLGASIHDIGKIYLPAEILSKPARLTKTEYALVQSHSQVGYDILKDITFPWPIADIAWQHHERLDGSGYPQGLQGDEICLEARIVAVADVVEAMGNHRPYRPALGIDKALDEIKRGRGKQYDSQVVDSCVHIFQEGKFSFD